MLKHSVNVNANAIKMTFRTSSLFSRNEHSSTNPPSSLQLLFHKDLELRLRHTVRILSQLNIFSAQQNSSAAETITYNGVSSIEGLELYVLPTPPNEASVVYDGKGLRTRTLPRRQSVLLTI